MHRFVCLDYDECDPAAGIQDQDCGTGTICNNTVGSYSCQCDAGYTGTAPQCTGEVARIAIPFACSITFKFYLMATR